MPKTTHNFNRERMHTIQNHYYKFFRPTLDHHNYQTLHPKRKRAYRKAKLLNTFIVWAKYKKLTNSVIRKSKTKFYDDIAEKLKSDSLTSKLVDYTHSFFFIYLQKHHPLYPTS